MPFLISYSSVLCLFLLFPWTILLGLISFVISLISRYVIFLLLCLYSDWYLLYLPTRPTPLLVRLGDTISLQ